MIICEHCAKEIEPLVSKESTGGHYGDTYAMQEWEEWQCPECGACPIETVEVEDELYRRHYRRYVIK